MRIDFTLAVREPSGGLKSGRLPLAHILEPCKAIEKLTADQVVVAVAVEIGEVRAGPAVNVDVFPVGLETLRIRVPRGR